MTRPVSLHLVRRWWKAVRAEPLTPSDSDMVRDILTNSESDLFFRFAAHDQRHALEVLARLDVRHDDAPRAVRRAALLHDIGKIEDDLSILERVVASVVGSRGARFTHYHAHESRGAEMLRRIGSDDLTVALVAGAEGGRWGRALREADCV